jgi:hypothetical protein
MEEFNSCKKGTTTSPERFVGQEKREEKSHAKVDREWTRMDAKGNPNRILGAGGER